MKEILVLFVLLFISLGKFLISADTTSGFSFASYYESNMVLQAYPARAVIWGFAPEEDIGSSVILNVTNAHTSLQYSAYVKQGPSKDVAVWKITLDPIQDVVHPFAIIASLKQLKTLLLENVLFGDVWFCSGQSNMKLSMSQIINSSEETQEAEKFNQIRFFSVGQVQSLTPLLDVNKIEIHWSVPNKENIKPFSAVCWLFAKYIYQQRPIPLGLVESSWGGTEIEAWSSPECLKSCGIKHQSRAVFNFSSVEILQSDDGDYSKVNMKKVPQSLDHMKEKLNGGFQENAVKLLSNRPTTTRKNLVHSSLWNAMVHPLLNMTIFGVLWYQGKANAIYNVDDYNCTLPTMISDWRKKWYEGTVGQTNVSFPVGIVQLGPTAGPSVIAGFSNIRWHQTADFGYLPNQKMPNTFLSVAYDLTDPIGGIHFRDKQTVSRRLALSGMAIAYGVPHLKYDGPFVTRYTLNTVQVLLTLEYDGGKHPIKVTEEEGFEICCQNDSTKSCSFSGSDWSPSPIVSWTNTTINLSVKPCSNKYLAGVRFAWRETPCGYKKAPVYSIENELPAPPFIIRRTFGPVFREDFITALRSRKFFTQFEEAYLYHMITGEIKT